MTADILSKVPCCVAGSGRGVLQVTEIFAGSLLWTPLPNARSWHIDVAVTRARKPLALTRGVAEETKLDFLESQRFRDSVSVARWRHLRAPSSLIDVMPLSNAIARSASLSSARLLCGQLCFISRVYSTSSARLFRGYH